MELLVFGKDVKLTPAVRTLIRTAAEGLEEHFRHVLTVHWNLTLERYEISVSCQLHARSGFYRASAHSKKLRIAVEDVIQKILTQRRRKKAMDVRGRRKTVKKS